VPFLAGVQQVDVGMAADRETQPDDRYSTPVAEVGGTSGHRAPRSAAIAIALIVVAAGSFVLGTRIDGSPRVLEASSATSAHPSGSPLPTGFPPASTASFERAVASARAKFLGSSVQIVAAKVVRYRDVSHSSGASQDAWVWVLIARGTFSFATCGARMSSPGPCPSPAATARVIVDFETGEFIEADVPAVP